MNKNIYMSKGYYPISLITESKKAKDIQVVFLSSRAEKTTKSSNSMFFFEDAAKKAGLKMIVIDPSSSNISKGANGNFTVVENGSSKKTYIQLSRPFLLLLDHNLQHLWIVRHNYYQLLLQ